MKAKARKSDKKKVISAGKFFNFCRKNEWEYFERINCSGIVIILAVTNDKKVLFVEQFRPPVDKKVIEFPAGLVNDHHYTSKGKKTKRKNESMAIAAKRELLEETGYRAKKIVPLIKGPVSSGASGDFVTVVRAFNLTKETDGGGDEFESIIHHEVPLKKVDSWLKMMEKKGFLIEPKVYTGLYFLKNMGQKIPPRA